MAQTFELIAQGIEAADSANDLLAIGTDQANATAMGLAEVAKAYAALASAQAAEDTVDVSRDALHTAERMVRIAEYANRS
jgi:hypothetical protein